MSYTSSDDPRLDAEIEGALARAAGQPLNSNPYVITERIVSIDLAPSYMLLGISWAAGWCSAKERENGPTF